MHFLVKSALPVLVLVYWWRLPEDASPSKLATRSDAVPSNQKKRIQAEPSAHAQIPAPTRTPQPSEPELKNSNAPTLEASPSATMVQPPQVSWLETDLPEPPTGMSWPFYVKLFNPEIMPEVSPPVSWEAFTPQEQTQVLAAIQIFLKNCVPPENAPSAQPTETPMLANDEPGQQVAGPGPEATPKNTSEENPRTHAAYWRSAKASADEYLRRTLGHQAFNRLSRLTRNLD